MLAIAICGILFTVSFAHYFQQGLMTSVPSVDMQQAIYAHRRELGGIEVSGPYAKGPVNGAFEKSLRLVLLSCCVLSLMAASVATFLKPTSRQL
jgi:hypothetical protein